MLDKSIFAPKSVAVFGASRGPGKLGYSVLENIVKDGFQGKVYPVNPTVDEVLGLPCYPDARSIPGDVDLAIAIVPLKQILKVINDCGEKGIKGIIIITAGFGEIGIKGQELETEMLVVAQQYGIRIMGPNCLGYIDTKLFLNATFAAGMLPSGSISLLAQSGSMRVAFWDWARESGMGLSKFFSLGNEVDINESDILEYLKEDENTRVVIAYLEGIKDGTRFRVVARDFTRVKPLIVLKAGSSKSGARAAASHTGTMAGSDTAYDALFKQTGVIRASSMEELFDWASVFVKQPSLKGDRLAIVTNGGGLGIMASDACEKVDLKLAELTNETVNSLAGKLSSMASTSNPVDIVGDGSPRHYEAALKGVIGDPNVDGAMVFLSPQAPIDIEELSRVIISATEITKPVLVNFLGGPDVAQGKEILSQHGIPNFPTPERTVSGFVAMNTYRKFLATKHEYPVPYDVDKKAVVKVLNGSREEGQQQLGSHQAGEIIRAYGIQIAVSIIARSADEAVKAATETKDPVVMKIVSPDILHKTEAGGVRVGIQGADHIRRSYEEICESALLYNPQADIIGVEIQPLLRSREVILGISRDPQLGHLVMFGLGGIYTEVLKDVTFRLAPLSIQDAAAMVREIRTFPLLAGTRNETSSDIPAIEDCLLRLSQLVSDFPQISELDINPLMVGEIGGGVVAVDCRLVVDGGQ